MLSMARIAVALLQMLQLLNFPLAAALQSCDMSVYLPALQTFASALRGSGGGRLRGLVAYPNSGEVWDAGARGWKEGTASSINAFGDDARQWVAEGASIVGGCCRTTPDHIRMLAQALKG